ncbi:MAG: hypothetical protein ABSE48_03700 [Verrucomicrobiota bacterium]
MKKFRSIAATAARKVMLLALVMLVVGGCGKQTAKLTSSENKAFDTAPAEVKQAWDSALAADKANDYVNAHKLLDSLKQMQLNDEQKQALDAETFSFQDRLYQTAETGDATAIKALQEIRSNSNRG